LTGNNQQSNLPLAGNRFSRGIGHFALNLLGWSFDGELPNVPKQVVIVAPHTSNWDFVIGILALFALGLRAHWIGKHTIFTPPFNRVMEWLGGIPVNRSTPNALVQTTTERFQREEKFVIGIAPEGTRKKVEKWKKGFYRIAVGANVPICCATINYRSRTIGFGPSLKPSGHYDDDYKIIRDFYAKTTAKFPEKFFLP